MKGENRVFIEAIKKALEGGWRECGYPLNGWGVDSGQWMGYEHHLLICHFKRGDEYYPREQIIFSHKFAKALWGETVVDTGYLIVNEAIDYETVELPLWQWHLQQMVIADDPLAYLEAHI